MRPFPIALSLFPDDKSPSVVLTEIKDLKHPGRLCLHGILYKPLPQRPDKKVQTPSFGPDAFRRYGRGTCSPTKKPMPTTFTIIHLYISRNPPSRLPRWQERQGAQRSIKTNFRNLLSLLECWCFTAASFFIQQRVCR